MKREKTVLEHAYEVFKGSPVDPASIYGDASGPATTNPKKEDEDEEVMRKCKALALYRAQKRTNTIDPPFSIVQKEYEAVIREVFTSRAGQWGDESQSSTIPHGPDETGTSTASKKPPSVGWTNQNQPEGKYRTTDPQVLPVMSPGDSLGRGPGASRGPANYRNPQSGLYPQETYVTTAETGKGQTPGDTFDMPYRDKPPSGYSATGYDTARGEQQQVKKGEILRLAYDINNISKEVEQEQLLELRKAPTTGRQGGAMGYREDAQAVSGNPNVRMDEDKVKDFAEARKLEEIGNRLLEEASDEESSSDARLKPREESKKREMCRKAFEYAAALTSKYSAGNYPSGIEGNQSLQRGTWGKKRHGAGF